MLSKFYPLFRKTTAPVFLLWGFLCLVSLEDFAQTTRPAAKDTSRNTKQGRRLLYSQWRDRPSNRYNYKPPRSSLFLKDPKNLKNEFRIDTSKQMSVYERIGDPKGPTLNYRNPLTMTYEDFQKLQDRRVFNNLLRDYSAKQDGRGAMGARGLLPKLELPPALDRLFGSNIVDFKPNGFVMLDFGIVHQKIDNPASQIQQRRNTNFDFNEQININFNGKVGENLGLGANFDSKASFNFENQFKLNYRPGNLNKPNLPSLPSGNIGQLGELGITPNLGSAGLGSGFMPENENIIQDVQVGNLTWQLPSQLIPGVQNLFGAKVDLRFGRLGATLVASQQRSRQQCITLRGGVQNRQFEIRADQYDENRHFFLSYFFRENYERWLSNLPMIMSGVTVTRVEVYVTNRTNNTETLRNIIGFSDLGEAKPFNSGNPSLLPIKNPANPVDNLNNGLYKKATTDPDLRQVDKTTFAIDNGYKLNRGTDYDILRGAKRLSEREYKFNPQLGYVSLVGRLQNDEILAVAYEYTINGRKYKVGELTEDYQARRDDEILVLKMLKSTTLRNNTEHPMWDLMMKNVYSLNTTQLGRQNFQMRIIYKDDLTGIDNPNLQEGRRLQNQPLLRVMGLDKLNPLNDPQPDGNFDFVEDVTVDSRFGRIMFPVLEPFGRSLAKRFDPDEEILRNKYVFNELYRTTQIDAQQITEKNKFFLKGSYQGGAGGSSVPLPYGVSERSVTVKAGGVQLQQGTDYMVEAQAGQLRIMNESVINSGRDIEVCYEQPDLFQNQIRTLLGMRLDYIVSRDMRVGFTGMRMRETPPGFLTRSAIGNEPVSNSIIGADVSFRKESRFLTKMLDALPLIQTKEPSSINFQGEVAQSFAGLHPQVQGRSFIDDFESARTQFDLTRQPQRWRLGATPQQFPQGSALNPLEYGYKRAKISAYTIDPTFSGRGNIGFAQKPANITPADLNNFYEKLFAPQDIFAGRSLFLVNLPENILDISYFPSERGMYNYNPDLTADGRLQNPRQNFGAVTRAIASDVDFDNANVENLEFWLMDPFKETPNGVINDGSGNKPASNTTGGRLVFNLGEISEDVVKNGRYDFETGLPIDSIIPGNGRGSNVAQSAWGYSTRSQFIVNAFTNQPGARAKQDVGLDGLSNAQERKFFKQNYLDRLTQLTTAARRQIEADPSGDDFEFYFSAKADSADKKIVARYKNFLGMENNTPEFDANVNITPASTNQPDIEDLNIDNTINDQESYYEYNIPLKPGQFEVGKNYIVDKVTAPNDAGETINWYQFRIPVREFSGKQGNINGFKSIRFMRMYLTDWEQPVVLRFAQLQLVATQYRKYLNDLNARGLQEVPEPYDAQFVVSTVSVEENSATTAPAAGEARRFIYTVPPGYVRDRDFTQANQRELNEQSMSLCATNLRDGDSRAAFKNVSSLNLLFRERIKMNVHMHRPKQTDENDANVSAFLRLGTDITENYYEIEITNLRPTQSNVRDESLVWPLQNDIDVALNDLITTKAERDRQAIPSLTIPYTIEKIDDLGRLYRITVVGRPDLSNVMTIMIGMRNPRSVDQRPQSFCLWVNELVVTGFENQSGIAAMARMDLKLADFATVQMAGKLTTFGFGGVQQKVGDRSRDNTREFSVSSAINVDKLLPEKWGFKIPLYINYDLRDVRPNFNPFDPDTPLQTSLGNYAENDPRSQDLANAAIERAERKGFNFSNVRKTKTNPNAKRHFWDFENLSFTYAFSEQTRRNSMIADYAQRQYKGGIAYQYAFPQKTWEPLRNYESLDRPYLELLKDFNVSPLPTLVALRVEGNRSFTRTVYRGSDLGTEGQEPFFEKFFLFNRAYDLNWNLTKSIVLAYSAQANAAVDEPMGDLNTDAKRDTLWMNFRKLGRMKNYNQTVKATYRLPLERFPLLDWMTADYSHNITYQYTANSLGIRDTTGTYLGNVIKDTGRWTLRNDELFGNTIRNSVERSIRGKIDFVKLYNKIKYLNFANRPSAPRKNFARSPGDDEEINREPSRFAKNITRFLMAVRGIDVDYTNERSTILPGFLPDQPKLFGFGNDAQNAPGSAFIFGSQDPNFAARAAENGWLSRSTQLNQPFTQTINKRFRASMRIEPIKDLRITLEARLTRGDEYRVFYQPETLGGPFKALSPFRGGNFEMSFMSFKTAFARIDGNYNSPVFEQFKANIDPIRKRLDALQLQDPNYKAEYDKQIARNPEFKAARYDSTSQDVLIRAFFAAYNGKDPEKVTLNPFLSFPLPNWRVDYGGLSQLKAFKKIFSSFTIEHSYQSTYRVGNFTSALNYNELFLNLAVRNYPTAVFTNDLNQFIPVFAISTISLSEKFAPLIGIRARTVSRIDVALSYNQDRDVILSPSTSQVAETFNRDITTTIGFTKNNVRIPFRINGKFPRLKNDLQARCTLTFRESLAILRRLNDVPAAKSGQINFQLRPQVNYTVSKLWSIMLYFDRSFNDVLVLNTTPRARTSGGIQVRFNVAEL